MNPFIVLSTLMFDGISGRPVSAGNIAWKAAVREGRCSSAPTFEINRMVLDCGGNPALAGATPLLPRSQTSSQSGVTAAALQDAIAPFPANPHRKIFNVERSVADTRFWR
jgi:hypothetical protein